MVKKYIFLLQVNINADVGGDYGLNHIGVVENSVTSTGCACNLSGESPQ